jgi:hypothetical protein
MLGYMSVGLWWGHMIEIYLLWSPQCIPYLYTPVSLSYGPFGPHDT